MGGQQSPFARPADAVLADLDSSEGGLSSAQVSARQQQYGDNSLPHAQPRSVWLRLFGQFNNVFIYILLISGLISALLQHYVDSGVILLVVVVNAIVGFIQEGKAEDALRGIMSLARSICVVLRDGETRTVESSALVPGDVVLLQAGDKVPADIRLFFTRDLACDESLLTGEAVAVAKHIEVLSAQSLLAERSNMAFMGTLVTRGVGRGVVTDTGLKTQIGQISELVGQVQVADTPLQQQLDRFARQLTAAIVIFSLATMLLGMFFHGYPVSTMFQAAVGIAVSTIPEGLPAIVTIALAIGVQRMAKNAALVRRLPAVEVLGSVDVICSDKTGTLTANAMTARELVVAGGRYRVSGEGYQPQGEFTLDGRCVEHPLETSSVLQQLCTASMLCNDARLDVVSGTLQGDPTEGALLVLALKSGLQAKDLQAAWPRKDEFPFDSEKRYMATLHRSPEGDHLLVVKGAPERLLEYAQCQATDTASEPLDKSFWQQSMDEMAAAGMRIMALASKPCADPPAHLGEKEIETGLTLLGLVGITDPPRPEAIESIRQCHAAGIRVKMITGDNPVTAAAIGRELGLNTDRVMTGKDLDNLDTEEITRIVEQTDIFARTSPANKLQLVNALQQNRHVVAMTGDGVNDAPALKKADIGVAMGAKGTDAARDAADFVLTDDNFSTIASAVREGRTVYDNIIKSIIFILPTSLAEAMVIFIAILLGRVMPITPAQVLWINMVTTVTLALILAFEAAEPGVMSRPPRAFGKGLFSLELAGRMLMVGSLGAFIVFRLFGYYLESGASEEYARTIAINALVMIEMFYLFNCRFLHASILDRAFLSGIAPMLMASLAVMLLQLVFTYLPLSRAIFGLEAIGLYDWFLITLSALPVLLLVELEKTLLRRYRRKQSAKAVAIC